MRTSITVHFFFSKVQTPVERIGIAALIRMIVPGAIRRWHTIPLEAR